MRITDAFVGEHAALYPQLDLVERAATAHETAAEARAHAALLAASLASHAALEEELLFVQMDDLPEVADQLTVMRSEHLDIEASLTRAKEAEDPDQAGNLLLHVVDVARPHFAKEEDVLFPLARRRLPSRRS